MNTLHVAAYVRSIPEAVERYRKLLGLEPAKVRHDYAKFELQDPPVIFSLNAGGEPLPAGRNPCCYAKAGKFWVQDADGIPWEMYTLRDDVEAETAADENLRAYLGQRTVPATTDEAACCAPSCCAPSAMADTNAR
jgi:catechol 2,3-dioxygenase-like lactoylglutathione lyase family enzyme